jgi:hypothetical protein
MDGATSMQVYVDKLKQLTTDCSGWGLKKKKKRLLNYSDSCIGKKMTEKVQQAYVLVGDRVTVKELFNFHTCSKYIFKPILQQG